MRFLLGVYGLTDSDGAWDIMLTLARESRSRGWWHQYGDAIPDWFQVFVGLEAEAATISAYDAEFVPGLLQTEDYARAVHRAKQFDAASEDIERSVTVRMARQELLTSDDGPQMWFVLNEAVIRRTVGGRDAMRQQLRHLLQVMALPAVTLQILPFETGAHPSMDGSFWVLGFPEPADPQVVYIEYQTGSLYLEKPAETKRYTLVFDRMRATALPVDASAALIARIADELT